MRYARLPGTDPRLISSSGSADRRAVCILGIHPDDRHPSERQVRHQLRRLLQTLYLKHRVAPPARISLPGHPRRAAPGAHAAGRDRAAPRRHPPARSPASPPPDRATARPGAPRASPAPPRAHAGDAPDAQPAGRARHGSAALRPRSPPALPASATPARTAARERLPCRATPGTPRHSTRAAGVSAAVSSARSEAAVPGLATAERSSISSWPQRRAIVVRSKRLASYSMLPGSPANPCAAAPANETSRSNRVTPPSSRSGVKAHARQLHRSQRRVL